MKWISVSDFTVQQRMHNAVFLWRWPTLPLTFVVDLLWLHSLWEFLESLESLGFGDNPQFKGIHRPETLPSKSTITITPLLSPCLSSCKRTHRYKKIYSSHLAHPLPSIDPMVTMTTSSWVLSKERQTPLLFQEPACLCVPALLRTVFLTHIASHCLGSHTMADRHSTVYTLTKKCIFPCCFMNHQLRSFGLWHHIQQNISETDLKSAIPKISDSQKTFETHYKS